MTAASGPAPPSGRHAYGCWRIDIRGRASPGGTPMDERADPLLTAAMTVLAANKQARLARAVATVGRMEAAPGHRDTVAGGVTLWLDIRAADDDAVDELLASVSRQASDRAERDGTSVRFHLVERGRR